MWVRRMRNKPRTKVEHGRYVLQTDGSKASFVIVDTILRRGRVFDRAWNASDFSFDEKKDLARHVLQYGERTPGIAADEVKR